MLTLSYSRIDGYLRCALSYYFKYEKGIVPEKVSPALVLGSAVHGTIAHYYRRHMAGKPLTTEELEKAFEEDWTARTTVPVKWSNGTTPEDMQAQGTKLVQAYVDSISENIVTPMAVELELRSSLTNPVTGETLPGVELLGYLDRLDADGTITELKTSRSSWSQFQVDTALQADIYTYMVAQQDGRDEGACRYNIIVKNKKPRVQVLETTRGPKQWDRMYRTIEQVVHAIADKRFYPNRGFLCPTCDFVSECFRW